MLKTFLGRNDVKSWRKRYGNISWRLFGYFTFRFYDAHLTKMLNIYRWHLSILRRENCHVFRLAWYVHQMASSACSLGHHHIHPFQQKRDSAGLVHILLQHIQHSMGYTLLGGMEAKERRACVQMGNDGYAVWRLERTKTAIQGEYAD